MVFDMEDGSRHYPSVCFTIRSRRELDALITYCCSWKITFRYDSLGHLFRAYIYVEDDRKSLMDIVSTFN